MHSYYVNADMNCSTNVVNFYTDCITTSWLFNSDHNFGNCPDVTINVDQENGRKHWKLLSMFERKEVCKMTASVPRAPSLDTGLEHSDTLPPPYKTLWNEVKGNQLEEKQHYEMDPQCIDILNTLQHLPCSTISFFRENANEDTEETLQGHDQYTNQGQNSELFCGPQFWYEASTQIEEIIYQHLNQDQDSEQDCVSQLWYHIPTETEEIICENSNVDQNAENEYVHQLSFDASTQTEKIICQNSEQFCVLQLLNDSDRPNYGNHYKSEEFIVPQLWYDASTQTEEVICRNCYQIPNVDDSTQTEKNVGQTEEKATNTDVCNTLLSKEECPISRKRMKIDPFNSPTWEDDEMWMKMEETHDDFSRLNFERFLTDLRSFSRRRCESEIVSSMNLAIDDQ